MEEAHIAEGERATHLSIVVPVYNDSDVIEGTLAALDSFVASRTFTTEVVIVDDGSTDGTVELIERFGAQPWLRLLRLETNRGKGYAVRTGMLEARGALVLFTDSDLSTPLAEADKLLALLKDGVDVAIGSRALPDSLVLRHQNPLRERAGKTFNLLVQLLVLRGFRDTQCGFKCFRANATHEIFSRLRSTGFEFDVEALCIARSLELRVVEVPVIWRNHPRSHVRFFRDSSRMFLGLLAIRRRYGPSTVLRLFRRGKEMRWQGHS